MSGKSGSSTTTTSSLLQQQQQQQRARRLLRLPPDGRLSREELRAAYRRRAKQVHPDAASTTHVGGSAGEFLDVRAAYETLLEAEERPGLQRQQAGGVRKSNDGSGPAAAEAAAARSRATKADLEKQWERWLLWLLLAWPLSYVVCVACVIFVKGR